MRTTAFLTLLTTLTTTAAQAADAPYVQASRLVNQLDQSSLRRIDPDCSLDGSTTAFLDRHKAIFDLLHAGAVAGSTDWGIGHDPLDMQRVIDRLNPIRSLATLEVMRARTRFAAGDAAGADNDFLDALAFERNIAHDHPLLIVALTRAGAEELILTRWAKLLPTEPPAELAALPARLASLPRAPTMADMIRAEEDYCLHSSSVSASTAEAMTPFYDYVAASLDKNPTPSLADFSKTLDDGVSQIGFFSPNARMMANILVKSLPASYASISSATVTADMFTAGVAISQNGPAAAANSSDPFGAGPYTFHPTGAGFTLRSKLTRRGDPVELEFGN